MTRDGGAGPPVPELRESHERVGHDVLCGCCEPVPRAGSRGSHRRAPTAAARVSRGKSPDSRFRERGGRRQHGSHARGRRRRGAAAVSSLATEDGCGAHARSPVVGTRCLAPKRHPLPRSPRGRLNGRGSWRWPELLPCRRAGLGWGHRGLPRHPTRDHLSRLHVARVEVTSAKPTPGSTRPHVVLSSRCPGLGDRGGR